MYATTELLEAVFSMWPVLMLNNNGQLKLAANLTKLCRRHAEVILNHENPNVRAIGQGEHRQRKYERLKLGGGQAYDRSRV
jgi:hypothetical protein